MKCSSLVKSIISTLLVLSYRRSLCSLCVSHSHQTSSASCSSPSNGCSSPPARMSGYSTCGIQVSQHCSALMDFSMYLFRSKGTYTLELIERQRMLGIYWLDGDGAWQVFTKVMLHHATESCELSIGIHWPMKTADVGLVVLPETQFYSERLQQRFF